MNTTLRIQCHVQRTVARRTTRCGFSSGRWSRTECRSRLYRFIPVRPGHADRIGTILVGRRACRRTGVVFFLGNLRTPPIRPSAAQTRKIHFPTAAAAGRQVSRDVSSPRRLLFPDDDAPPDLRVVSRFEPRPTRGCSAARFARERHITPYTLRRRTDMTLWPAPNRLLLSASRLERARARRTSP